MAVQRLWPEHTEIERLELAAVESLDLPRTETTTRSIEVECNTCNLETSIPIHEMKEILHPMGTLGPLESSCDRRGECEFSESRPETGGDDVVVMVVLAVAVADEGGDADDKTFQCPDCEDENLLDERQDHKEPC